MSNAKAREAQYRQSDVGRMNRRLYNQRPEVRQHKAILRAIKRHRHPPKVSFGLNKPPVGHF